jgi:pimeloyl-ACP methyl ester carboxylesterase
MNGMLYSGARLGKTANIHAWTLVVSARETKQPTREIVEVLREHISNWQYQTIDEGGHMFPLTHPEITNRLISTFLGDGSMGVRFTHHILPSNGPSLVPTTPQSG